VIWHERRTFTVRDRETAEKKQVEGMVATEGRKILIGIHATEIDGRPCWALTHIATAAFLCAVEHLGEATVVTHTLLGEIKEAEWPMAFSSNRLAASEYLRHPLTVALLDCRSPVYFMGRWRPGRATHVEL
jgi:hypothetical protein